MITKKRSNFKKIKKIKVHICKSLNADGEKHSQFMYNSSRAEVPNRWDTSWGRFHMKSNHGYGLDELPAEGLGNTGFLVCVTGRIKSLTVVSKNQSKPLKTSLFGL